MTLTSVKGKLHEYIERADEKKIQALYTLVENDIENRSQLYDEASLRPSQENANQVMTPNVPTTSVNLSK